MGAVAQRNPTHRSAQSDRAAHCLGIGEHHQRGLIADISTDVSESSLPSADEPAQPHLIWVLTGA
jgi:hypothetical protein